jgi:hypothetical protein
VITTISFGKCLLGQGSGDDSLNLGVPAQIAEAYTESELAIWSWPHEAPATLKVRDHLSDLTPSRLGRASSHLSRRRWRERLAFRVPSVSHVAFIIPQ